MGPQVLSRVYTGEVVARLPFEAPGLVAKVSITAHCQMHCLDAPFLRVMLSP